MDIETGRLSQPGIRRNYQQAYFYEETKPENSDGIEDVLGKVESCQQKFLSKICAVGAGVPSYGSADKRMLQEIAMLQLTRTDAVADHIKEMLEQGLTEFTSHMLNAGAFDDIGERGEVGRAQKGGSWEVDPKRARREGVMMGAKLGGVLDDLPVVRLDSPNKRILLPDTGAWWDNLYAAELQVACGLGSMGTVVVIPVAPHCAIMFADYGIYDWTGRETDRSVVTMDQTLENKLAEEALRNAQRLVVIPKGQTGWAENRRRELIQKGTKGAGNARTIPGIRVRPDALKTLRAAKPTLRVYGLPPRPTLQVGSHTGRNREQDRSSTEQQGERERGR